MAAKRALRESAISARRSLDPRLGQELARHVLAECLPPQGTVVAGFWPFRSEIDVRPLLHALHERGHVLVLPVTGKRGEALRFREWRPGDPLRAEAFGTVCPAGPERAPDFLLVPLLAFDRAGGRLGYGAGFYDRTLSMLRDAFALGCAYAAQEVAHVPTGPHDVRLDAVATERGVILCKGG